MKKGNGKILVGSVLIFLQTLSIIGNRISGRYAMPAPVSGAQALFDLLVWISSHFVGIVGVLLLIIGCVQRIRSETQKSEPRQAEPSPEPEKHIVQKTDETTYKQYDVLPAPELMQFVYSSFGESAAPQTELDRLICAYLLFPFSKTRESVIIFVYQC